MASRNASHAADWYSADEATLSSELDDWLSRVPYNARCIGTESAKDRPVDMPVAGARAIIAPHAGYSYSGPAAAWAYRTVDWSRAKRIFLLGPSHHFHFGGCALSPCETYKTPLGDLQLDLRTIAELYSTERFTYMKQQEDEDEHSLEMHLPYIYKMLSRNFPNPASFPRLVPILVGSTAASVEKRYGKLLAPYLADPTSIFIVSSDFCHWGTRFRYTYYQPAGPGSGGNLRSSDMPPTNPPIHESIRQVDQQCMDAIETGKHDDFLDVLEETGNTVCGRHPIGVVMAAVEELGHLGRGKGIFNFVRYDRSDLVQTVSDSSVSYCSAFAIF